MTDLLLNLKTKFETIQKEYVLYAYPIYLAQFDEYLKSVGKIFHLPTIRSQFIRNQKPNNDKNNNSNTNNQSNSNWFQTELDKKNEIRKLFNKLSLKFHPDKLVQPSMAEEDRKYHTEMYQKIVGFYASGQICKLKQIDETGNIPEEQSTEANQNYLPYIIKIITLSDAWIWATGTEIDKKFVEDTYCTLEEKEKIIQQLEKKEQDYKKRLEELESRKRKCQEEVEIAQKRLKEAEMRCSKI